MKNRSLSLAITLPLLAFSIFGFNQEAEAGALLTMQKKNTNFGLDGHSGGANQVRGKQVKLYDVQRNNRNQQWRENSAGRYYTYRKSNTSVCLDGGNGGGNRQAVTLEACDENNQNQHWDKVRLSNGSFRLEKRGTNFSIDGNHGGQRNQPIYLWASANNNVNQQWLLAPASSEPNEPNDDRNVKVFILAGQSNMVGYGTVTPNDTEYRKNGGMGTLQYLLQQPGVRQQFEHLVDGNGDWLTRDDVILSDNINQSAPLSVITRTKRYFGPEMQFGQIMGDKYENPVLIIKAAYGATSLGVDWRPPSSGGDTGINYNLMLERIDNALSNIDEIVPNYNNRGYDIVGFGWHQGWKDLGNKEWNGQYQTNMVNFVNDVREELHGRYQAPLDLPFVIASTGQGGFSNTDERAPSLWQAQLATPTDSRLVSRNVSAIDTRGFFREESMSPSPEKHHWHRNAETYFLLGDSMAEAMLELQ